MCTDNNYWRAGRDDVIRFKGGEQSRTRLVALVDFLGPGSNFFPGMSGIESDWSEGQVLRNTINPHR